MAGTIVWLRQDLRLADNPALAAAVTRGGPVVALYIWSPEEEGAWAAGGASRWWLHGALASLADGLAGLGSRLILRRGPAGETLRAVLAESGADAVLWNRRYEPAAIARDTAVKAMLQAAGVTARSFCGSLLYEAGVLRTKQDRPYQVFTPFWKSAQQMPEPDAPVPAPSGPLVAPDAWPSSLALADLGLLPTIPWDAGLAEAWTPGESGGATELARFLEDGLAGYPTDRDRPDRVGTSRLSPYLHHGELSVRQIWHAAREYAAVFTRPGLAGGEACYLRELGWREFAHHLLYHFPHTPTEPLREAFAEFPWRSDDAALRAWQRGRTGYPLVDAGMRQLWATGWMHNRVRMVVASFLVKNLRLDWQHGAAWFWDTLVDADLANNTLGWQWSAGCGADAAPYFRIFNPITQSEKFDPQGRYIRRWVPELAKLDDRRIHSPWTATPMELAAAGIRLGDTYPEPIVDHATARAAALDAYAQIKAPPTG